MGKKEFYEGLGLPMQGTARMEDAEWNPPPTIIHESVILLRSLRVGDTKRICHEDVTCVRRGRYYHCTLTNRLSDLRKKGWQVYAYHESVYVMVVRRVA